ncbi:hypothetical protein RI049_21115 [Cedecea neteri]|uniref:hypothetical protein n=1 Tax=Cedecea neteri TaxID=158822 RepID=UPI002AA5F5D6|nr:hypothetical protein [Cedecea neteri]WPU22500.1 hypothetical protein RI049_21115 [Cedecea neteri]
MSEIKELNFEEIAMVSGGNANSNYENASSRGRRGSTNYGGQANGFQPNLAAGAAGANMYNDLTSNCGLVMIGGTASLIGATVSRSPTTAIGAVTSMIAGCRNDSRSSSKSGPPFR